MVRRKRSRSDSIDIKTNKFSFDYHVCDLKKKSKSGDDGLPPLSPSASFGQKFRRFIQKNVILNTRHPETKLHYRSQAALTREITRHVNSKYWYIIHPFSRFRLIWEMIIFVVLLMSLTLAPFMLAFYNLEYLRGASTVDFMYVVYTINDFILILDIVISFNTGIQHHATKFVSLDAKEIASDYSRSRLTLDLITSAPFHIVYLQPDGQGLLNLLAECTDVLMIFRMHQLLKNFGNIVQIMFQDSTVTRIAKLVVRTLLSIHWAGCLTYYIPKFFETIDRQGSKDSWLNNYEIETDNIAVSTWSRYVFCMYHGVSLFTGGSTAFSSTSMYDKYMSCIIIIWGTAHHMNVFVIILQIMIGIDASQAKYVEVLNQLKQFMRNKHLSVVVQKKIMAYFEYRFQKYYFHEHAIMATLSENLHKEIILHSCRALVSNVELFRGLPKAVIGNIIGYLKQEIFLTHDVIVKAGSIGTSMYFLSCGTVAVISPLGKESSFSFSNVFHNQISTIVI
ncbi:potassium/sodium hyperpolarization-activated cyclic nucleotide-gated channel 1-like [Ctenocephalides felis]|uniref:potassium/sodium hyperpolarization-activated cyclic nucleotide-gated channel 1-like n=1 Tax=Ctenocephalides felis TaxID=7515 RepID=UPI000E6E57F5|nr:potassium/sodium hyperpolarization-activated cyclic nucleotide-gated channel 1-like [Ctenocephalides felis]